MAFNSTAIMALNVAADLDNECNGLRKELLPVDWLAATFDANGTIKNRTHEPEKYIGRTISSKLLANVIANKRGAYETVSLDGTPVVMSFDHSAAGCGVAVSVPKAQLFAELYRAMAFAGIGALFAFGLALALARKFANGVVHVAYHDRLTGACTRLLFHEIASRQLAVACRSGGSVAFLAVDLDGFKAVNDTHGHDAGDTVLRLAAERMMRTVRESDVVARFGGDEFVIMLSDADKATAVAIGQKIIESLSERYSDIETLISASIGVVVYPPGTVSELLTNADAALTQAKKAGKRRVL